MTDDLDTLDVVIDDDAETIRVDPDTGSVERDLPNGGVEVLLDPDKIDKDEDGEDKWFANLVDKIDMGRLALIADELYEQITADDNARNEQLQDRSTALTLLGTELKKPKSGVDSGAVDGMSTVTNPLLLEACLKAWANAQAELLPASGPAKIQDDPNTTKDDELAERLESDFNLYLTKTDKAYYTDTSVMLLWGTIFGGMGYKKVYKCPLKRRPVSVRVDVEDLILSAGATSLAEARRITNQIEMAPSTLKRMQHVGYYRGVALPQPSPQTGVVGEKIAQIEGVNPMPDRPEDQPYTIWECQCELDIPDYAPGTFKGEGIPIPYVVTIDKDSREVLAVRRDWDEDDDQCQRKDLYVDYPYIPGPGCYGTGMLNLLGNSSAAMTAAWRIALDSGMFANFPGGLISKQGARQNSSLIRVGTGEFFPVETGGGKLSDAIMPLPYKDVTPGLMAMMDKITEQSRGLGASLEIPVSEGLANVPVGTMLANIEQATKVMAAAHKGLHQAQSRELSMIMELFRQDPESFWRHNKLAPKDYWNAQKLLQAFDTYTLVPVSDPNIPSHIHRVATALALVQLIQIPQFTSIMSASEVLRRALEALKVDPAGLIVDTPAPQPNLQDAAKMVDAQAKGKMADAKMADVQAKQQKNEVDEKQAGAEMATKGVQAQTDAQIAATDLTKELVIHASDQQKIDAQNKRADAELAIKAEAHAHNTQLDQQKHGLGVAQFQAGRQDALHAQTKGIAEHALKADTAAHKAAVDVTKVLQAPKKPTSTPKKK